MRKILLPLLVLLAPLMGFSQASPYCGGEVRHLGIPAEVVSGVFMTIENTGAQSMRVTIESAIPADTVDLLLVTNGTGAAISPEDFSVPGQISRDLTWVGTPPDTVTLNVLWSKVSFGGNWQLSPADIQIPFLANCATVTSSKPDLPITFEDTATVTYALADFGGNSSQIVVDPTNPMNLVVESTKSNTAQLWAGTTAGDSGLVSPIPFEMGKTRMRVRVWSPDAGIPVRLKVENSANGGTSAELDAMTTVASQWETLEFDFANSVVGTLDFDSTYDKVSIFFNFGTDGATAGTKTYYWDDVQFVDSVAGTMPLPEYCNTQVFHMMNPAEVASSIFLTITNTGPSSMRVTIESVDPADTVDVLIVPGGSGAAISPEDFSVPGQISRDLTWTGPAPDTVTLNVLWSKVSFGGNWQLSPADFQVLSNTTCTVMPMMPDLPITFEDTATVAYDLTDFGGNSSQIVVDPTNPMNLVVESTKSNTAQLWAGTTAGDAGLANPIPFEMGKTRMSVRVWSPDAGIPVRLKVENSANGGTSAELDAMTTVASQWETLEFDFANSVVGTLDFDSTYDKVSIFFNFGTDGATAGTKTYYWDDVQFVDSVAGTMPLPEYCNTQVFHMMNPAEVASSIFLTITNTGPSSMRVTIESVDPADTVDVLIVPGGSGAAISPEDFSVPGQISRDLTWTGPAPDTVTLNVLWSKVSFGGNWQLSPADFQVLSSTVCATPKMKPDLPITFEDTATIDYFFNDFNGTTSQIVVDPTNPMNLVVETLKDSTAALFAGTTAGDAGLASPLPFASNSTRMTVRVWSPDAGIPVRLKVENSGNGGISVETEDTTTVAGMWETLEFDFANQVTGAALDLTATYDKVTIFFNFGTDGATAGNKTYFWDDVDFGMPIGKAKPALPITFEDTATVDYNLGDFGGNVSQIIVDPTDPTNLVVESVKGNTAQDFAGTTAGNDGLEAPIPFTPNKTRMRVRVWSPDAGIPVRLKVENSAMGSISVETEAMTTVASMWETLEFDFNNNVTGTPAIDFGATYDKASIFFNFGTPGSAVGDKTYYWDDVAFVDSGVPLPLPEYCNTEAFHLGIPAEVASAIFLTIENTGAQSMKVTIESANNDSVDFLLVNGGSGAAISAEDFSVPGKISRDLTWTGTPPDTVTLNVLWSKVSFGGNWQLSPNDIQVDFNTICLPPAPKPELPITFEDTVIDYNLADFAGTFSQIVEDPTDPTNTVVETTKGAGAQDFAGTVAGDDGLASPIPFILEKSRLTMRVWSPDANIPVRIKVENANDDMIFAEAEANTTVASQWETLTFDFLTPPQGAPGLNLNEVYGKIIVFFNFGVDGATAGAKTYYWDDVAFDDSAIAVIQPDLPVTFEDPSLGDYNLGDFEGNVTQIVTDPTDPGNTVAETEKTAGAATFAGTTVGAQGLANPIPFATDKTRMTVRVWSPDANIPVRLKVENSSTSAINSEAEAMTTVASQWETLTFNFATPPPNIAPVDTNNVYDKVIIFFNFGVDGATAGAKTYYWDDVAFLDSAIITLKPELPITFEDTALGDYDLGDFNGTFSQIITDPVNPNNKVVETFRSNESATFAGTTAGTNGLASAIPFTMTETKMSVAVWSPDAGIPVRLKVENAISGGISVETEDTTTVAMAWEYLVFDFTNNAMGTPPLDVNNTYDKVTIFFNFGAPDGTAGDQTFYWDNVSFGDSTGVMINVRSFIEEGVVVYPNPAQNQLNVRFETLPVAPVRVTLYDLNGRLVKEASVRDMVNTLNLGDLTEGMYLFMLESEEGVFRQKITVRR